MIKKLLAAVALSLSLFSPAMALDKSELPKAEQQMFLPVIQVGGNCSGSVIHSKRDEKTGTALTYILTAKHCVKDSVNTYEVRVPDYGPVQFEQSYTIYSSTVKGVDPLSDTAILKLDNTTKVLDNVVKLAPKGVKLYFGEDVWTVGYPFKETRTVTEGVLSNRQVFEDFVSTIPFIRATSDVAPGSSGGALFHKNETGDYEQIGLTTGGKTGNPWYGVYTPIEAIQGIIAKVAPEVISN